MRTSIYCKHPGGSVTDDLQRLIPTKKLDKEMPGWYFEYDSIHGPFCSLKGCEQAMNCYLGFPDPEDEIEITARPKEISNVK